LRRWGLDYPAAAYNCSREIAPRKFGACRPLHRMKAKLVKAIGILMMLSALALALTRAPDRPVETLVARWAPPPSDFIEVRGQLVHLRDEGPRDDPLPIVLVHGTSASLHTWEGWTKALRTQRRVITFDLPGFGLTGPSPDGDYRAATHQRFVLELLDTLKVQRFVIGGNSLGGEVAWRTAVMAPERVDRLILVAAAGPKFEPLSVPLGWHIVRLPVLGSFAEHILPRSLVVQGLVGVYGDPAKISSELVDRYYELTLREGNRRALGERLRQYQMGADAERIATLKLPTLILWGGRDKLIPPAVGLEFKRQIEGSQLVVFDELGHVPHEEDPARTLVAVKVFLGLK
jgi:pimeloyl-ACP methyl ester carboxylesterase